MAKKIYFICLTIWLGICAVFASETDDDDKKIALGNKTSLLSLEDCIELATKQNRDLIRQEEDFIIKNLSYALIRHSYSPLLSGTLGTDYNKDGTISKNAEISLTKKLPTGGDIGISARTSAISDSDIDPDSYNSTIGLKYVQPLLKNAGTLTSMEALTSSERELKYAERSLILFKQDFLISIIRQYCRLLQQKKAISNQEQKVENAKFLLERSKAQMDRGRASPIDVYRAEISLLQAENDLLNSKDSYQLALDEFKLDLGLPSEYEIDLEERELHYSSDMKSAEEYFKLALDNRLDYKTAYEKVIDSKRKLDIARNKLRSRLDLDFSIQTQAGPSNTFSEQDFGEGEWVIGLEYEIPFDRTREKKDYRESIIDYLQKTRNREALRDRIVNEVRVVMRDIRKAEMTIKIQERNIEVAEKQLERAKEDYDRGAITNRDYVDALNDLTDAKNNFDAAIVDFFIANLERMRVTGTLDYEKWKDLIK